MLLWENCIIDGNKGTARGYAKVNLTLDVTGIREDGYHNLETIMRTVDLYDTITIELNNTDEISLTCDKKNIPTDERNIAYKAAQQFLYAANITAGMNMHINKVIPSGAGMGGGSADGAAVLVLLNKLFNNLLSLEELLRIGAKIGADVPFCIMCGTCLATGIGDVLERVEAKQNIPIVVVKPELSISTPQMYRLLDMEPITNRPDTGAMLRALMADDIKGVAASLVNVMEPVAISQYEEISAIKNRLIQEGALGAVMTGSGSAVFGVFESNSDASACAKILKNKYNEVYSVTLL